MRNVQSDGTADSPAPTSLLSFSPKLSKSRSVFAPLSKSSFYFSEFQQKKKEKRRKKKSKTCLHFISPTAFPAKKADLMGGNTPVLPPTQLRSQTGLEQRRGWGLERGRGHPGQRSWGCQAPPPAALPRTRSVQGKSATFRICLSDCPRGLPCPGCPQLSSRCWEASLTQDISALLSSRNSPGLGSRRALEETLWGSASSSRHRCLH